MDIKVKAVLDFIQSQEGYEHSIVAGGAVRDYQFELEPRDYDFFVPTSRKQKVRPIIDAVRKEFKLEEPPKEKGVDYGDAQKLSGVNEIVFEGKIIDIIGKEIPNDEEFGSKVVSEFDFGLNMAFYNGLYIDDTNEHFQTDFRNYRMSLINLESIAHLPRAIERYNKFRDKAWTRSIQIRFDSPNLKWSKPVKKEKKIDYYRYTTDAVPDLVFWNNEPQQVVNPAREIPLDAEPARRPWNDRIVIADGDPRLDVAARRDRVEGFFNFVDADPVENNQE